jgi:serine/threonine protein kinase
VPSDSSICIATGSYTGTSSPKTFSSTVKQVIPGSYAALVKLIDFGLAKEEYAAETDYVATRWYRSPENLIGMKKSTVAIDIFALGCVAVELFTLTPLFPGSNTVDQLSKIFSLLGTPTAEDWPKGYSELKRKNLCFGYQPKLGIGCVMQNASP